MSEKISQNEDGKVNIDSGWGSLMNERYNAARQIGAVETTGAVVYDKDDNITGKIPEQPTNFELTNMAEYSRSMSDTINFLEAYSFDQTKVLMREDGNYSFNRKYTNEPEHMPGYQEKVDNLIAEREYLDELSEWVRSFDESEQREDGSYNVFDAMGKIREDMKNNRAEKEAYAQKLKESGIDPSNPVSQGILADYDKKHGAMFRTNKTLHKKYNKGEDVGR